MTPPKSRVPTGMMIGKSCMRIVAVHTYLVPMLAKIGFPRVTKFNNFYQKCIRMFVHDLCTLYINGIQLRFTNEGVYKKKGASITYIPT